MKEEIKNTLENKNTETNLSVGVQLRVIQQKRVLQIKPEETYEWILKKHYAKRLPSISWAFGFFADGVLEGIITFGKPASPSLCKGVLGVEYESVVYELNRLVINEGLPENTLSYFVSRALKLLPKPLCIVSYADTAQNHHGYIYQATNWIYTGATKERTDIGLADNSHSRHYDKNIDYKANRKLRSSKHRYIYFVGNKRQKSQFQRELKYDIKPYPKGDNKRYNADYKPNIQLRAFAV